jgi:hypothetical protein
MVTRDKEDTVRTWYVQYEVTGKMIAVKMSNAKDFNSYSSINITILNVDAKQLTMKNDFYAKGVELKLDKQ